MKKVLLLFLLAVAGLQAWADEWFIVGSATLLSDGGWPNGNRDLTQMTESNGIYTWTGMLKNGQFKVVDGQYSWDGYHPETADQEIYADDDPQTMTQDNGADYKWKVVIPGIYTVTLNPTANTIAITPDWLNIGTADELIAFANSVNDATEGNPEGARWARLTADIDMSSKTFPGIGRDDKWKRYHGTLDGQGHKISHLTMTSDNCGLVTVAGGGCTVKNILIDNTCEFNGNGRNAALISCNNYTDFGNTITIENCGNEANVTGTGNNCAGIHGCNYNGSTKVTIKNCFNAGNISSTGNESAPISGWTGANATIRNTWNIGEIANEHSNNSFLRWDSNGSTYENCFTTLNWGSTITGKTIGYDAANVSSGLLCFTLNGNASGGEAWKQTLPSSSGDAYPYPGVFAGHAKVYANGSLNCDGTPKGDVTYSNAEGENRDPHNYVNGFCSACSGLDVNYLTPVNGYYEIGTMHDLHWFSQYVIAGNPTANAKLTADIEQESENQYGYTPIGTQAYPYRGTFNGQEHSVTLRINNPGYNYQGLFGVITDGAWIERVVVKGYINGGAYVGGIAGGTNGGSSNVQKTDIWYCGNEATITASGNNGAGIIGVNMGGSASIILRNCYNTGNITASDESGALSGWLGGGWSSVTNCYNSGTVKNGETVSKAFGRNNGCYFTNCYYTETSGTDNSTENKNNGYPTSVTDAQIASGEFCYMLNDGGDNWYQNLTGTVDAMPVPFSSHSKVYANAHYDCAGNAMGTVIYGNTDDEVRDEHVNENGFCTVCNSMTSYVANYMTPAADGYYEIADNKQMRWFAATVNAGTTANARLTADIDFTGIIDYAPIGTEAHRYVGTFDGQGHQLTNLTVNLNQNEVGVFGVVAEGSTIKNFTLASSCSITGNGRVGIIGMLKRNSAGNIYLECIGNEGSITGGGTNIGGILGVNMIQNGGYAKLYMTNCYTTGAIVGGGDSGQLTGWGGYGAEFKNCYAIGEATNCDGFARLDAGSSVTNCYCDKDLTWEGHPTQVTDAQIASGEVCAKLGDAFHQTIGTGHPVFDATLPNVYEIAVSAAGYATFVPKKNIAAIPTGVTAFVAQELNTWLNLVEVSELPADNAIIVKANQGSYYCNSTEETRTLGQDNVLTFSNDEIIADGTYYILAKPANMAVGFYQAETGTTISAGKAYYKNTNGAKAFYFDGDEATAIKTIDNGQQTTEAAIYNLAGQRIQKMQKGINIVNGRKVLF